MPHPPKLSLSVQYQVRAPKLPRWRLRRWVIYALQAAGHDGHYAFQAAHLNLRVVGLTEGRQLNHTFRGHNKATNVLTFAYGIESDGILRSDIVLCLPRLLSEAREQGKPLLAHAAHLTIHGVLHALGYDHLTPHDARHMEKLETDLLNKMGIADPYAPR